METAVTQQTSAVSSHRLLDSQHAIADRCADKLVLNTFVLTFTRVSLAVPYHQHRDPSAVASHTLTRHSRPLGVAPAPPTLSEADQARRAYKHARELVQQLRRKAHGLGLDAAPTPGLFPVDGVYRL
jgi:hypothetical protein